MALCKVLNLQVELCLTFFARCKYTVHITSIPSLSRGWFCNQEHFTLYKFLVVACKMCQEMNCMRLHDRMSIRVAVSRSVEGYVEFQQQWTQSFRCSDILFTGGRQWEQSRSANCSTVSNWLELFLSACRITVEYQ
ncbi:hypothetical protein T10_4973 [Trichinella papuae]|uniref:Uncharacterized protein n=1 Tax=Trichinella papuae TaxID=268474 RepID=A0A0V1N7Z6_9BILA|nr:hypothetical protein T10_4973 [Trichinella papuae]